MPEDRIHSPQASDQSAGAEEAYEPPRAEEVSSEGQAATAAWIQTASDNPDP